MARQVTVHRVRQVCRACGRLHTASSRHGIYFHCQWCGALNAGPALIAAYAMAAPPARGRKVLSLPQSGTEPRRRTFLEVLRGDRPA